MLSKIDANKPTYGLSPLEIELILDKCNGSIFLGDCWKKNLSELSRNTHKYFSQEEILRVPQFYIDKTNNGYRIRYNENICTQILDKVGNIFRADNSRIENIREFVMEIEDKKHHQERILEIILQRQYEYISQDGKTPLKNLTEEDISKSANYPKNDVTRLLRTLSIELPSRRKIFARDLIYHPETIH